MIRLEMKIKEEFPTMVQLEAFMKVQHDNTVSMQKSQQEISVKID